MVNQNELKAVRIRRIWGKKEVDKCVLMKKGEVVSVLVDRSMNGIDTVFLYLLYAL
jgi:hypothetical protein